MKQTRPRVVRACLVDIEGVLVRDKRYQAIPGAVAWIDSLVDRGIPFCLVSNNTTHRPAELVAALAAAGFAVDESHLVGVLDSSVQWLHERSHRRILWLGTPRLRGFWRERGFVLDDDESGDGAAEAVVLGVNPSLAVDELDQALPALLDAGADLLCLHRNLFYLDAAGRRRLGPGAWAEALAALGGEGTITMVGKPAPRIYNEALERIGVAADETLFISDDPVADLVTAGRLGMTTAFVLSGKYADHAVLGRLPAEDWPDIISDRLADLELPKRADS